MREQAIFQVKQPMLIELLRILVGGTQSPLKVGFVSQGQKPHFPFSDDANRLEKIAFLVRRQPSDSLRRHGAAAAILQPTATAPALATLSSSSSTLRRILSQRSDSGSALRSHRGIASHQPNRNPPIQRNLSLAVGAGTISRSDHVAAIFAAIDTSTDPQ